MNEKLKNIFVPYNVAKLAFEKGFTEWCKSIQGKDDKEPSPNAKIQYDGEGSIPIFVYDYAYLSDDSKGEYGIPEHSQLIVWLKDKHNIDVVMDYNGLYKVFDSIGNYAYFNDENEFEINQALEVALNLLPNYEHDKQEYL